MNRKTSTRILSVLLALFLLIPHALAAAPTSSDDVSILSSRAAEGDTMELANVDGAYMYFHDTEAYTLAITVYCNQKVEIAKNDKIENVLLLKNCDLSDLQEAQFAVFASDSVDEVFSNMEAEINQSNFAFDTQENISLYEAETINTTRDSSTEIAAKVDAELTSIFGSPYTNTYRAYLKQDGYTAYLYETMYFERYNHISWTLDIGSSLVAVASVVKLPESICLRIFTFVGTALTGYSLYSDVTSNKYVANVHNSKSVRVSNTYPYRAGRTEYGYCYVGDRDAAYVSANRVTEDSDFSDNTSLLQTGIYNYINSAY